MEKPHHQMTRTHPQQTLKAVTAAPTVVMMIQGMKKPILKN